MTYIPRISRSLGILLLSAGACLADRATLDETKTQFALPMDTPPTIDGVVEAAEWGQAAGANNNWRIFVRNVTDPDGNQVPTLFGGSIGDGANAVPADDADLSYQIFAGYDADYLYIAVKVRDSVVVTDSAAEGSANGTTWMDDSVEVFIDGDNSNYPSRDTSGTNPGVVGSGGQFVITANNAYRDAEAGSPGYGEELANAWYARTTVQEGSGYEAEFRISLKTIGNPKPGEIIGFSVAVNDDDDNGGGERQVIWVGKPHTECSYGNLILDHKSYTAPKVAEAPTVDGVINPQEYAGAERISVDGTSGNYDLDGLADAFARADLNYRAWVVHTADAVYVAVDVVDDLINTDSAAPGSEDQSTWEDDSVEIFFDGDHSKKAARDNAPYEGQYVLSANGAWRDNEANNPTFGAEGDWYAATTRTFKGYQMEFKINKTAILNPGDGSTLGFNIAVNDDDGANRKAQLNWDGRPHSEYTYGHLTLGPEAIQPATPPGRSQLDETKTQFALPMDTPPTIDGVVEAAEWGQAAGANNNWRIFVRNVTDPDGNQVPTLFGGSIGDGANAVPADDADLSYQIFAGYDADYLYIAVKVRDSVVVTDSAAEGSANGTTWMDDSVEVFIDGDNSNYPSRDTSGTNPGVVGSGGQFVITANNAYRDAEAGSPGYGEELANAWYARTTVQEGSGYEAEFRISLKTIGNPKPGEIIGFSVAVNDDDDNGGGERQVIWVGKPHTECSYGNLILDHKSYTAPKVAEAPTVDGVINPQEYAGAERISVDGTSGNYDLDGLADAFARADLNYRAWVVHTADAVYVAVDVVDDLINTDTAAAGSEDQSTWEDDSVEIFFDGDHSKKAGRDNAPYEGQYVLSANGAWRDNEANNPTFGAEGDWYAATTRTFKGYQMEFKINKTAIVNPEDGSTLGFNIAVNDDDGVGRKAQLNWDGRPHSEYTYGHLTLAGESAGGTLRITQIESVGNNVKLTISTPNGAGTHVVQTAANIAAPQWSTQAGVTFGAGAAGTITATFPKPADRTQFYRVQVQ